MYEAKRPVKSVASETQQQLDKLKMENYKNKILVKELEKKLSKYTSSEQGQEQEEEIRKST